MTNRPKLRRWMQTAIAASTEPLPVLPYARGQRRQPEAIAKAAPTKKAAARA